MDIALVLDSLVPAGKWQGSVTANTEEAYNNIRWNDERSKPTWEEVQAEWVNLNEESGWEEVREWRDYMLAESDWTQLSDSPLSSEEKGIWVTYRQDLRDIPQDYITAGDVEWPETPTYSGSV